MEIKVQRLRQVLDLLAPAVSGRKTSLPITQGVLFHQGLAIATNLEVGVSIEMKEAQGEDILVPFRELRETLKYLPSYARVVMGVEGDGVQLVYPGGHVNLKSPGDAQDFPPFPSFTAQYEAKVDGDILIGALQEMVPYTAREDSVPVLGGVCIALGDPLEVAAADGFRLAWRTLDLRLPLLVPESGSPDNQLVMPQRDVKVLFQLWQRSEKPPDMATQEVMARISSEPSIHVARLATARRLVRLGYNKTNIRFQWGSVTMVARLVGGTFPQYRQLIPTEAVSKVSFFAEDLLVAVRRQAPVAKEGSGIVRLAWSGNELQVSASADEVGSHQVTVSLHHREGEDGHIAFNYNYLIEYLKEKEGPVAMNTRTPTESALFSHRDTPLVLIMPMFVAGDGEPEPPAPAQDGPESPGEDPAAQAASEAATPPADEETTSPPTRKS